MTSDTLWKECVSARGKEYCSQHLQEYAKIMYPDECGNMGINSNVVASVPDQSGAILQNAGSRNLGFADTESNVGIMASYERGHGEPGT